MQTIKNPEGRLLPSTEQRRPSGRPSGLHIGLLLVVIGTLVVGCRPPGVRALLKGKDLLERGKIEEAVAELRAAAALLPTNALAFHYLGLALQESGQAAEAERSYYRALSLDHELAETRYNLGCLYLEQHKVEEAKSELTAFTLLRPSLPEGWIQLGTAQLRSRDPLAAEHSFNQALRLKPQDPECLTGIGLARLQRKRATEAVQWFGYALKLHPDYGPALLNLAIVAQENLKDQKLALQQYRRYLALEPPPEDAAAVRKILEQLELEPAQPAIATRAQAPSPAQRSAAAPPRESTLASHHTTAPQVRAPRAVTRAETEKEKPGGTDKAHPRVELAKAAVPTHEIRTQHSSSLPKPAPAPAPQPRPTQARTAAPLEVVNVPEESVFKSARDVPTRLAPPPTATASAPSNPVIRPIPPAAPKRAKRSFLSKFNPARLFSSGKKARSEGARQFSALPPGQTRPPGVPKQGEPATASAGRYKYLSPARPKPGNRSSAERAYTQGVEATQARRLPDAILAYRRATQFDPAFFDAQYNLGVVTAETGDLQSALEAYEYALAIRPESLDARYNFALVLVRANFPVDALHELEKLLALYPNESRAHLVEANLYAQQFHQLTRAREHYLKVLALDPTNSQAAAIRFWLSDNPSP